MSTKRTLARKLSVVREFEDPNVALEQYRTPPELAANLVHTADLQGDVADRTVVDLGCGTGMLALGMALRAPDAVLGVDLDPTPIAIARENEREITPPTPIAWIVADATRLPLCPREPTTVVMNPPFGAQSGHEHADREFLVSASEIADVSYSVHNAGSAAFVEAFAADNDGEVTHAFAAEIDLDHRFSFHSEESRTIDVELFRIEWNSPDQERPKRERVG